MPASLKAFIKFTEGENIGSDIRVVSPRELTIGRSEQCDIFVGEKKVSRKHARLIIKHDGIFIEDLDSTNGTFVDGKRIGTAEITSGSSIRVGMTVFTVTIDDSGNMEDSEAVDQSGEISRVPVDTSAPAYKEEEYSDNIPQEDSGPPSIQEMDLSQELPLIEPKEEIEESSASKKRKDKKKALSGNLSEMALPDILQMLKNNHRSGVLAVTTEKNSGGILFLNGKLLTAYMGRVSGLKAVYRLLTFNEGDFELQPLPDSFEEKKIEDKIELGLENILIEGMRQIDELEKIRKQLPSHDTHLEINKECPAPLSKLHPKVLDILQIVISKGQFGQIMDHSPLPDLETGKIIFYLIKKGYIKTV